MVVDGHLGGYMAGGDPETFYPELWTWLVEECRVRTVLDVGCGPGHAMNFFADRLDCDVWGIDGIKAPHPLIEPHDYTTGPYAPTDEDGTPLVVTGRLYDLAWSSEFVEHVEERYVPNFLATFQAARLVAMTHAVPGQAGWHHVNCRTGDYWQGALAAVGYVLDDRLTRVGRERAALNERETNYFRDTGMIFRRAE